jgi:hypothetical protein
MLSICSHYNGQQGRFLSFTIPAELLSGVATPADFTPTDYSWIYAARPIITDIGIQRYNVSIELNTVPPEGANLNGSEFTVNVSFADGAATASTENAGAAYTVGASLVSGIVADNTSAGFDSSVTISSAFGAAAGGGGDPNFSSVSLLLHGNGANNSTIFFDDSQYNLRIGNTSNLVSIDTAQSKFGGSSIRFDGAESLEAPGGTVSAVFAFSGDFTMECWFRISSHTATTRTLMQFFDGSIKAGIALTTTNVLALRYSSQQIVGTTIPAVDTWHHAAVTRAAGVHRLFLNGVQEGGTYTLTSAYSNARLSIGVNTSGSTAFTGWLDDIRITDGIARYTAGFTPPATQFADETLTPGAPTNPTFANVSLLLHMDGSNGSTTFTDSSTNAFTVTANGNAQISTAQSKYGGASGLFDGAGDYLDLAANTAFDFGTGDFTVEFWYRSTATPAGFARVIAPRTSTNPASGGLQIWHASSTANGAVTDAIELAQTGGTGVTASTKTAISDSNWHHIAFSRQGTTVRAYFDGVCKDVKADNNNYTRGGTEGIRIAGLASLAANTFVNGYIDDLRITKGVAIYTKPSYTPPAAAFPDS